MKKFKKKLTHLGKWLIRLGECTLKENKKGRGEIRFHPIFSKSFKFHHKTHEAPSLAAPSSFFCAHLPQNFCIPFIPFK